MPEVVSNTSPLQYLHQLDLLELLPAFYGQVTVPGSVVRELAAGRSHGVSLPAIERLSWARVQDVPTPALLALATDLGPGEREAIAIAIEAPGSLVLLDDALARRHARLLGLAFTGTLGLLLRAKRERRAASIAPLLDRLHGLRFHLDPDTRREVLRLAGE